MDGKAKFGLGHGEIFGNLENLEYNYRMLNLYSQDNQTPVSPLPPAPKGDFHRYEDPTGEFTSKDLSLGWWWVKYKVLLYRLLIGGLIALSAGFWLFSLVKWGIFLFDMPNANLLEKQSTSFINYNNLIQHFNPKPLQIISTNLFQDGIGKVEAIAEVENLNDDFYVSFDYVFLINGTTTAPAKALILAKSKTLVAALGFADTGASGAVLQIKNLQWQRISAHDIKDAKSWQDSRINFSVASTTFENPVSTPVLKSNRLAFILKNESAYGYKQPRFYVGLYTQGTLVGVMPLQTDDFRSQEEKSIDLRNFTPNLQVQSIEIFPQINIYDPAVYLAPEK